MLKRILRDLVLSIFVGTIILAGMVAVHPIHRESAILTYQTGEFQFVSNQFTHRWNSMIARSNSSPLLEITVPIQNEMNDFEILNAVNDFVNQVPYQLDNEQYGISDYWASPYEFFTNQKGDCEDYAIAKYFILRHLGMPAENMGVLLVRQKDQPFWKRDGHAILLVNLNGQYLILDNATEFMYTLESASRFFDFIAIINENGTKNL